MTRQIIRITILFFFLSPFLLNSQTISSIEIEGAENFSSSRYQTWMKISTGAKIFEGIEDSLSKRITFGLISEGYYNSQIRKILFETIDSSNVKLQIVLNEGTETKINRVVFSSTSHDSLFVSRAFERLKEQNLSQQNFEPVYSEILDRLENNGFPFAKIRLESIYFFDDSISGKHLADIYFSIDNGEQSKINIVEIEGNTKTKDYVITRAAGVNADEIYEQIKIENIPASLNRLRFFEPVELPQFYFNSKNQGVLKIIVKEKETNNFDGVFGYVPSSNKNEKGFFTGYINIGLRNLFGTGRSTAIRWQQENRYSQELELRYLEPWLFNYPFNLEAGLYQRKQDSTYVQRTIEGKLEFLATQDISASIIVNSQSTIPSERKDKKFTVFNSSSFTSGVNFKVDTRDDFYAPTKGLLLMNAYKFTSKKISGPNEFITPETKIKTTFQRLELDFLFFLELFKDQIAALGVHARELRGNDVEISDLYFLGGTSTMRGYREKQFMGNRIFWSNLEYRYLLTRRSFAFLFFDTGYYLRNGDESKSINELSDFKTGYGFGLNIETGLGVLGVSFALGKGDSFSDGKIHFGIINEF